MKRFAAAVTSLIVVVLFTVNIYAQSMYISYDNSASKYSVTYFSLKINGEDVETDVPPVLINKIPMVPVRAAFEKLGADPVWDKTAQTMTIDYNGMSIRFRNKSRIAVLDKKNKIMEAPARLVNDRLMIPLGFFDKHLGMAAEWSAGSDIVSISNSGVLNGIECTAEKDSAAILINLTGYRSHNVFRLSGPDRIVMDFPFVNGPSVEKKIDVGIHPVKSVRYAQFGGCLRVVFDVEGQPEYDITKNAGGMQVIIGNRSGENNGEGDSTGETGSDDGNANAGGNDDSDTTDNDTDGSGNTDEGSNTGSNAGNGGNTGGDDKVDRGGIDRDKPVIPGSLMVVHRLQSGKDEIAISIDDYRNYSITRLSGPDRIVLDFPGAKVDEIVKAISAEGSLLKSIRCGQFTESIARVVLDVKGQPQYDVREAKGVLQLFVEEPTYRNVEYQNNGDRVCLILNGAKLTEGASNLRKLYTASYDSTGRKYTISFPSKLANLNSGVLKVNDSYIDSIEIKTDKTAGNTSITFNAKDKFIYHTITREVVNNTAITILKPASKKDRLVVIDAGHGGAESGAVAGTVYEKDLNLDIALRLNALLKAEGVKTYMIREDDSYVGLYERSYIANNLNATLFLSIHNNALDNPDYAGTMTLYLPPSKYAKGFTSMRFAQIIQEQLLKTLKTIDRKIIQRPELVVLKATDMHAALAEVGFMTNKKELSNLLKAAYRQEAAKALCNATLQALQEDVD